MGWLSSLLHKDQQQYPALANYSILGADMHSHLIPNIDDGAKSLEESVQLIRSLVDMGYKKLYTTPHIMGDFYRNTPEIIREGLEKVRVAVKNAGIPVELAAAAEYYFDEDFLRKLRTEQLLTYGDNYLLFEFSYLNPPENIKDTVFLMQTAGYKPVLAHPERYVYWMNNLEIFSDLVEHGVLLQLNINSASGYYGREAFKIAQHLIENNLYSFAGSDVHHTRHTAAMQQALQSDLLKQLVASGKLLNHTL